MSLVKMRTAELIGPALDWAVAKADGHEPIVTPFKNSRGNALYRSEWEQCEGIRWQPSTDWGQGGPLIAEYRVSLEDIGIGWIATPRCCTSAAGSMTPQASDSLLVAACRAIVCASIGDTVQIPSELIQ